ncbi:ABC transporter permease [Celeribacter sp. SCSIO 80788]|jgi:ABC-type polysaccharide/polyol phosphate export permease|uniref:ABC transporter permease n=1 Tax=Celeribacter sp. SCSIO 80788 TaxID=3117013 RepID=UPI003DA26511
MFHYSRSQSGFSAALTVLRLIFVNTVRHLRKSNGSPIIGLLLSISQAMVMIVVFSFMYTIFGVRSAAIRGDFLLYLMSGIFLFLTHNKALAAVAGSETATSPMMQHAPMNTAIAIISSALSALYIQVLTITAVLCAYSLGWGTVTFENILGAFGMLLLAWASGSAIGMVFLAARPWAPGLIRLLIQIYTRANMITSGKMFVANQTPNYMLAFFSWNPLFHTIDQARGFIFVNYNPHKSSIIYPVVFSLVFLTIGLLAEFFTRKRVSLSWSR